MSTIRMGGYKDLGAVILENKVLRAMVLPDFGSKLASLVYKPLGRELLWQNPGPLYLRTSYGDPYTEGELSGFDEMFPTISRCHYERAPWSGVELPDHGEVWTIPWSPTLEPEELRLQVHGMRLPYRLEKRLGLEGGCLRIAYRAVNLAPVQMDYLWAAHPLFNASPGMELIVPEGMNRIVNTVPGRRLGSYGAMYDFPLARLPEGPLALNRVPPQNAEGYQKYYFCGRVPDGWCLLYDPEARLNIGLSYPRKTVPYLGIWLNEGGFAGQYNIAPEPATAAMDRIDLARMWGTHSVLEAGQALEWHLNITVEPGDRAAGLTEDGVLLKS
jgi:galactose mutarotase-like enzyme